MQSSWHDSDMITMDNQITYGNPVPLMYTFLTYLTYPTPLPILISLPNLNQTRSLKTDRYLKPPRRKRDQIPATNRTWETFKDMKSLSREH